MLKEEIYRLMDSFLVESDKPRPIRELNIDRHIFVKNMLGLFSQERKRVLEEAEEITYQAIMRMQIIAIELAGRQNDEKALKIINDIRGKYEELLQKLEKYVEEEREKKGENE